MTRKKLHLLAWAVLTASAPASAQVILNGNNFVSPSHPIMTHMFGPLCQDIEKATSGRVKCNILPKAVVAPPQTFDAIRDGLADISYFVHGYTPGRFALTEAPEFPAMGYTAEASAVAYHRIYERMLVKADEHKGVIVLAVFTSGPADIYNLKRPVASLKDLQGLKIRIPGGMANEVARVLGAVPIVKPAPEMYELFSAGVVDGALLPKEAPASFKLVPLIKHVTYVPGGLFNVSFAWIANPAKWNSIPAADRKAIAPLLGEALARRSGRAWDIADAKGLQEVKAARIPAITASPQFVSEIKARTAGLESEWIEKKARPKGVDGAAVLKALREENARLSR